jgi:hypothetical protein
MKKPKEDIRRFPAIRSEEKLLKYTRDKVTVIDGKSEFHLGWRKCLEWVEEEYDIKPKQNKFKVVSSDKQYWYGTFNTEKEAKHRMDTDYPGEEYLIEINP